MANEKRLIDANALISNLRTFKGLGSMVAETLVRFTEKQPTVDAVEVVRCKDCQFSKYFEESGTRKCRTQGGLFRTVQDDDFCSYGERREGNG
jgi:hypothetical protein